MSDYQFDDVPPITVITARDITAAGPEALAALVRAMKPSPERARERWGPGHFVWMNEAHEGAAGDRIISTGFSDCLAVVAVRGDRVLVIHDGQYGDTCKQVLEDFKPDRALFWAADKGAPRTTNALLIAYCSAKLGNGECRAATRFYTPCLDMHGPPDLVYDNGRIWLHGREFTWPEGEEPQPSRSPEMYRPADRIADYLTNVGGKYVFNHA